MFKFTLFRKFLKNLRICRFANDELTMGVLKWERYSKNAQIVPRRFAHGE